MAQIIASSLREHRESKSNKLAKGSLSALVVVLFASFIILSVMGGGTIAFLSLIGIAICITCLFRREVRIDWWIFIPLAVYLIMNLAREYHARLWLPTLDLPHPLRSILQLEDK